VKVKNPRAPAVRREAEEHWGPEIAMREAVIIALAFFLILAAALVVQHVPQ
jgi:hypothetical protein